MNNNLEKNLNTTAYFLIIIAEIIYIYVTQNEDKLSDEENYNLVSLARFILVITSLYFLINAFIGLKEDKNIGQYKQVIASILALIAASIRLSIKNDDITFR